MRTVLSFALLLYSFLPSLAQIPGGVQGSELWFITTPSDGYLHGKYHWKDFSGDSARLYTYDSMTHKNLGEFYQPSSSVRHFNFHPALSFSSLSDRYVTFLPHSSLRQRTVIGVFAPHLSSAGRDAVLYRLGVDRQTDVLLSKRKVLSLSKKDSLMYGQETGTNLLIPPASDSSSYEQALKIVTYSGASRPVHSIWGNAAFNLLSFGTSYVMNNADLLNNSQQSSHSENPFMGYCPELIVYGRSLSHFERLRVESYLALKYGITLKQSYLDSQGNLLWDAAKHASYHHRVAGLLCDQKSGFIQSMSTTSYEETPYLSVSSDSLSDSFYNGNPYYESSSHRLLVIGLEGGERWTDGEYMLWGDNNADLQLKESFPHAGVSSLNRRWLLHTSPGMSSSSADADFWETNDLRFSRSGNYFSGFVTAGPDMVSTCISSQPLYSSEGYYAWTYNQPKATLTLRFGGTGNELSSGDYGYRIDAYGNVYRLLNGVVETKRVMQLHRGDYVQIYKNDSTLFIRSNQRRNAITDDIVIAKEHRKQAFYAGVSMVSHKGIQTFDSLEVGGFNRKGVQVELSGHHFRHMGIQNFSPDNIYLTIDGSGDGAFLSDNVRYIACSRHDKERDKFIFDNVCFDIDGNGSDVFTFSRIATPLVASFTPKSPGCESGLSQNDGSIAVDVLVGRPVFNAKLYRHDAAADSLIYESTHIDSCFTISSLAAGSYTLHLSQVGGVTLGNGTDGMQAYTNISANKGGISWHAGNEPHFYILSLEAASYDPLAPYSVRAPHVLGVEAGLMYEEGGIYAIKNYEADPYPFFHTKPGDQLRFTFDNNLWSFWHGDTLIYSASLPSFKGPYRLAVSLRNDSKIHNVEWIDFPADTQWRTECPAASIISHQAAERQFHFDLENPCDTPPTRNHARQRMPLSDPDNKFFVHLIPHTLQCQARLQAPTGKNVSLAVFDVGGKLLKQGEMTFVGDGYHYDFSLLQPGVYLVKAWYDDEEFTRKIIINSY